MKYIIASDLHGSAYYTKKLIEIYNKFNINKMFLLGDILFHGPRNPLTKDYNPEMVFTLLNELENSLVLIKGNCDSEVDQMVLKNTFVELALININNRNIYLSHGHKKLVNLVKNDIIINGHTHVHKKEIKDDITYLNSGSISLPKENTKNSFILIDGNKLTCYDLEMNQIYELNL